MTAMHSQRLRGGLGRSVRTILNFPDASFHIVQGDLADLVAEAVEIHGGRYGASAR